MNIIPLTVRKVFFPEEDQLDIFSRIESCGKMCHLQDTLPQLLKTPWSHTF